MGRLDLLKHWLISFIAGDTIVVLNAQVGYIKLNEKKKYFIKNTKIDNWPQCFDTSEDRYVFAVLLDDDEWFENGKQKKPIII